MSRSQMMLQLTEDKSNRKNKKSSRASFSIVGKIRVSLRSIKGSLRRLHGRGGIAPSWPFVQVFQGNISSNYIFIMV